MFNFQNVNPKKNIETFSELCFRLANYFSSKEEQLQNEIIFIETKLLNNEKLSALKISKFQKNKKQVENIKNEEKIEEKIDNTLDSEIKKALENAQKALETTNNKDMNKEKNEVIEKKEEKLTKEEILNNKKMINYHYTKSGLAQKEASKKNPYKKAASFQNIPETKNNNKNNIKEKKVLNNEKNMKKVEKNINIEKKVLKKEEKIEIIQVKSNTDIENINKINEKVIKTEEIDKNKGNVIENSFSSFKTEQNFKENLEFSKMEQIIQLKKDILQKKKKFETEINYFAKNSDKFRNRFLTKLTEHFIEKNKTKEENEKKEFDQKEKSIILLGIEMKNDWDNIMEFQKHFYKYCDYNKNNQFKNLEKAINNM